MKIIFVAAITFFCSIVNAEMYKCTFGKQTSYQDRPCEETGSIGQVFKKKPDISKAQQRQAKLKLELEAARIAEQKQLEQEAFDQERRIRAEEDTALAAQQYAEQARRQAEALEERNYIESRKPKVVYDHWNHNPVIHNPVIQNPIKRQDNRLEQIYSKGSVIYPNKQRTNKHTKSKHAKMNPPDRMNP